MVCKGDNTDHNEIKSIQYGIFITFKNDAWEFRTIDEVDKMKGEMDDQMKKLVEKTKEKLN